MFVCADTGGIVGLGSVTSGPDGRVEHAAARLAVQAAAGALMQVTECKEVVMWYINMVRPMRIGAAWQQTATHGDFTQAKLSREGQVDHACLLRPDAILHLATPCKQARGHRAWTVSEELSEAMLKCR